MQTHRRRMGVGVGNGEINMIKKYLIYIYENVIINPTVLYITIN
jgi:hypothetical protein